MKKKPPIITFILYLFLFVFIGSVIFIYYFQKKLGPELITCAENQVKYLTTLVVNNSIRKYHKTSTEDNFLKMTKNEQGEIILIEYNTKTINETTTKITEILESDLQNMTKGNLQEIDEKINDGIIVTVSVGTATGSSLLANTGPKIPLKLKLVGEVNTTLKSKVKEYGLNNAIIEIYVETETTTVIQMPFLSKEVVIKNEIPLTMQLIQGTLPEYYIGNSPKSP